MAHPLFSCVMPVKGARPYMDAALASLCNQGMGDDLEIIIQDADIEPDEGQSDALNKGFAKAHGEWLFWLNADDVLLPGALKEVKSAIRSATRRQDFPCWITGNELFIDKEGRRVGASVGNSWHDWLYRHVVPHVNGPSAFFQCELFEKVGGFDTSLHICMDWDLWIRFMKVGARFERVDEFLWAQRRWSGSKTQREIPPEELSRHQAEISRMLAKNDFKITRGGVMLFKLWRLLNGNYLQELMCGR